MSRITRMPFAKLSTPVRTWTTRSPLTSLPASLVNSTKTSGFSKPISKPDSILGWGWARRFFSLGVIHKRERGALWDAGCEANTIVRHDYAGGRYCYADCRLQGCAQTGEFGVRNPAGRSDAASHPQSATHSRSGSVGPAQVPSTGWPPRRRDSRGDTARQSADPREDRPRPETVLRWSPVG